MASNKVTKHLQIYGRVQGVSYRYWTQQTAQSLGLSGWVRNRKDGSVEALVHGEAQDIEKLVTACNDGPSLANVGSIEVCDAGYDGTTGFEIKPSV